MKQALMEVMRMNRICRMVLVTCFGSFILVIFYFQIIRRNPFGMDICCRKGSRSPLQELYNPIQLQLLWNHAMCMNSLNDFFHCMLSYVNEL
nr:carbohydrate sulfotransferase 11-like isoform X2 [Chelonoidis abingdonii]